MVVEASYLISYFVDEAPVDIYASSMPKIAKDIVIARVHIEETTYLLGRYRQVRTSPPPKNQFRSRLKILEVLSGKSTAGRPHHQVGVAAAARA
jgi:hypothetical protein